MNADAGPDPLPSWREGSVKTRLLEFVAAVSTPGDPGWVAPQERIAVFDNDGTLWSEQPMYVQLAFALQRARSLVAERAELASHPLVAAALADDIDALMGHGLRGLLELAAITHAGMADAAFSGLARDWLREARHPQLGVPYTGLVYQPMLELLAFLRARGFRSWIVTGGGVEFVRVFAEATYGIPPDRIIGSTLQLRYGEENGQPTVWREPVVDAINDGDAKPLGIARAIGRRPIAAFGNSDGDLAMLRWTTAGPGQRLALLLHHDDGEREVAYDRASRFGRLDKGLDLARRHGWCLVSLRRDWDRIFPCSAQD
ncbi:MULTISPECIES: HAD family hydrolase [Cyanophyceae]|uniref:HAD family hydrolase n=1 Tax=Aphanothece cf. minutissima CCALA 015 TaxID=2107695 RepID=A0ABX5F805_9CHRO|nr:MULTISPECIES: HAD family hydrolase [Cyanophyceae]MCP9935100.1 haloacid dehalogenase-like hydrolase [Cyanobium sp. Candia 9D4]PSB37793.1 HAD family hydrolase [Aphanothece cf. minutissima CCALA 015]